MQNRHTRRAPSVQNIFGLFLDTPTERSVVKMTDVLRTRFKEETDRCSYFLVVQIDRNIKNIHILRRTHSTGSANIGSAIPTSCRWRIGSR